MTIFHERLRMNGNRRELGTHENQQCADDGGSGETGPGAFAAALRRRAPERRHERDGSRGEGADDHVRFLHVKNQHDCR